MVKCKAVTKEGSIIRGELVSIMESAPVGLSIFTVSRWGDPYKNEPDINFLLGNCRKITLSLEEDPK